MAKQIMAMASKCYRAAFAAALALVMMLAPLPAAAQSSAPPGVVDQAAEAASESAPPAVEPAGEPTAPAPVRVERRPAAAPSTLPAPVLAPIPAKEISAPLKFLKQDIANAKRAVDRLAQDDASLSRQRSELAKIVTRAAALRDAIAPRLVEVGAFEEKLGPRPGKGEAAEAPEVAATRAKLAARRAELDGAIKTTRLIEEQARQFVSRIQSLRQTLFSGDLLRRTDSPLAPGFWRQLPGQIPLAAGALATVATSWAASAKPYTIYLLLLSLAALGAAAVLRSFAGRIIEAQLPREPTLGANFFKRARTAAWLVPLRVLPYAAGALLLYSGLAGLDLAGSAASAIARGLLKAFIIFVLIAALGRTVLAPGRAPWRLVNLSDITCNRLNLLTVAIAATFAAGLVATAIGAALRLPLPVQLFQSFLISAALAGLFAGVVMTPFTPSRSMARARGRGRDGLAVTDGVSAAGSGNVAGAIDLQPWWLKGPLVVLSTAIVVSSLLGYVSLGGFVSRQVVVFGTIIGIGLLLHFSIRAFTLEIAGAGAGAGTPDETTLLSRFGLGQAYRSGVAGALSLLLHLGLVIALAPWLALQWGVAGADIISWGVSAIFGFEIGGWRISPSRIAFAIGLFVLLLFATRLLQRWLDKSLLRQPGVDAGIAHSVHTAVGYGGVALAALIAVSYAGLNVTNLAIVAGALSVGIGFGLQSIVNNFVSGLILLVERPIKVGDLIVVGSKTGHVRRISVRATEIETFDKSSVIVPNSELITGAVTNFTHRNRLARAVVKVGVSYDADPDAVRDLLIEIGKAHPLAMKFPAPAVHLDELGSSSLDFSLKVQLADISQRVGVETDLRIAILKAMRAARIEVPYQQYDIHLRDLDGAKQALAQLLASRKVKQGVGEL